jgi:hypothetical protein
MKPLPQPCGWCGRQLTKGYCAPCSVKLLFELSLRLEHIEEENRKQLWLSKLRYALRGAGLYLPGFDMTAINQAIKDAGCPASLDANNIADVNRQGGNHAK